MKITKTSDEGIDLIKKFEEFMSKPYKCPAGIPTIAN
jgi:GH24 family phage-related lysozyme (muramidase)